MLRDPCGPTGRVVCSHAVRHRQRSMTTEIAISRIHFPVTKLGPGRRIGIWVQGCSVRCPGCISVDTWAQGRGRTTVSEMLGAIATWKPDAEGVTGFGGGLVFRVHDIVVVLAV